MSSTVRDLLGEFLGEERIDLGRFLLAVLEENEDEGVLYAIVVCLT